MTITGKTAADRIKIARGSGRPTAIEYIEYIFDDFFCLSGDRLHGEDASITGGIAFLNGSAVTVIGHQKGILKKTSSADSVCPVPKAIERLRGS